MVTQQPNFVRILHFVEQNIQSCWHWTFFLQCSIQFHYLQTYDMYFTQKVHSFYWTNHKPPTAIVTTASNLLSLEKIISLTLESLVRTLLQCPKIPSTTLTISILMSHSDLSPFKIEDDISFTNWSRKLECNPISSILVIFFPLGYGDIRVTYINRNDILCITNQNLNINIILVSHGKQ